jgi:hypothetical protein
VCRRPPVASGRRVDLDGLVRLAGLVDPAGADRVLVTPVPTLAAALGV